MRVFNRLYVIDAYKHYRCAWVLLQLCALSNNLCIRSVVRVGPPLVICEVSFRSPWGAERNKREKPCRLSIDSITKVTYWPPFFPNAYEERHNASYIGAVDLRFHSYQDSSWAASRCQIAGKLRYTPTDNGFKQAQLAYLAVQNVNILVHLVVSLIRWRAWHGSVGLLPRVQGWQPQRRLLKFKHAWHHTPCLSQQLWTNHQWQAACQLYKTRQMQCIVGRAWVSCVVVGVA